MTRRNVTKPRFSIKSFLSRFQKKKVYLASLEIAYIQQSAELCRLRRFIKQA